MSRSDSSIAALVMVIRASLAELRNVATDMARSPKKALSRLIEEAGVLSGALQRLDRALEDAPPAVADASGLKIRAEVTPHPEAAAKVLLALDRARRAAVPGGRCRRCGGVL